jgi:hypothetical protein
MSNFHDLPTHSIENRVLRLEYLTTAGPRIVGLSYQGSNNLFVDVHELFWNTPNGKYFPLGGHRLWSSPESPENTYLPDWKDLELHESQGSVELDWHGYGMRKTLRIELDGNQPKVTLLHTIANVGDGEITCAPWAITMFRQGGIAILPQPVGNVDPHGLLPNRSFVLWPYTRLSDARLELGDEFIHIHAQAALPPIKLGYRNTHGWMAYWLEGILFKKTIDPPSIGAAYPDGGCNVEVYCNNMFIELESLGPLVRLTKGDSINLKETWELFPDLESTSLPAEEKMKLRK